MDGGGWMVVGGREENEGGGDVCLATTLTSLTTAGPGSYAHTHMHTMTYTHTHIHTTERPNQYVTKEGGRMMERVGDKLQKMEEDRGTV